MSVRKVNVYNNEFQPCKPSEVIKAIKNCINLGFGIVPLIGSGMSVASGIPAGIDYTAYLFYCLARVFGTDGTCGVDSKKAQWDPNSLRWPDYSEVPIYDNVRETMLNWSSIMKNQIKKKNNSYDEVKWQAIGAAADWRAMLHLLSRLSLKEDDKKNDHKEVIFKYSDHRVIDSFFVNLTKGKKPNSSHLLLAHLADILRVKVILTTNFDNLIETAFQTFVMPVTVFDVHMDVSLPDADFVRAQRSIVKMHGGRYGLRADFSLDKYPTTDDEEKFAAYLSLYYNKDYIPFPINQRNLLVMGIAPKAGRTIALICGALIRLQNLEIYWICHSETEIDYVLEVFTETFENLYKKGELDKIKFCRNLSKKVEYRKNQIKQYLQKRIKITAVPNLSLFLLELYQNIFLSLPPAGVHFPSVWPIPHKPCINRKNNFENKVKELKNKIEESSSKNHFIYIFGENGVNSMAAAVYYQFANKYNCIWITLEQTFEPYDFIYTVIETIARKTGLVGVLPAYFPNTEEEEDFRQLEKQFKRVLRSSKRKFIIFINGRELEKKDNEQFENNLILEKIRSLLKDCLHSEEVIYVLSGWPKLNNSSDIQTVHVNEIIVEELNLDKEYIENELKSKNLNIKDFYLFILSLTFVQHSSYSALLHSWAFIKAPNPLSIDKDNDELRYQSANIFLDILRKINAIRDDEGHFVFLPQLIRKKIKKYLGKELLNKNGQDIHFIEAESHQGIADWYMKLYRASGDIQSVFDSVNHRLQCFQSSIKIDEDDDNKKRFLMTSLIEMELALKLTYHTIFSSFHTLTLVHSFSHIKEQIEKCETECKSELERLTDYKWYSLKLDMIKIELDEILLNYFKYITHRGKKNKKNLKKSPLPSLYVWDLLRFNENEIKKCYELAKQKSQIRCYREADEQFNEILKKIKLPVEEIENINIETEKLREIMRGWVNAIIFRIEEIESLKKLEQFGCGKEYALYLSQDIFKFVIKTFRRYQLLKLYYAQIKRYIGEDYSSDLKYSEKIYICSTEIMRYVSDNDFLNRENAFLRTNTGIMLSWMKRYHESYRRYNEAYGYLSFGIRPDMPLEFAVIDLRRGETFLSQITQEMYENHSDDNIHKGNLSKDQKCHMGILFDAISSIDRAEYRMKGATVNSWWYCWLYELQLSLCVNIVKFRKKIMGSLDYNGGDKYDLYARCRECEFCGFRFISNLEKSMEIVGDDVLRIKRYLNLSLEFKNALIESKISACYIHNNYQEDRFEQIFKFGEERLVELLKCKGIKLDNEIEQYVNL